MNVLVLEENYRISKIFEKIFLKKNIDVNIVGSQIECLEKFENITSDNDDIDYIILDKSRMFDNDKRLEDKILELKPSQKVFFLSPYLAPELENMSESAMIIQKPFALITLLTKLELKVSDDIILKAV